MFRRADANRDGQVTLDEVPSDRQERFRHFLARADKDGDKAVSVEEARRAAAAMTARARGAMAGPAAERPCKVKPSPEAKKKAAQTNRQKEAAAKKAAARKAPQAQKKRAEARKKAEAQKKAASQKKAAAKAETRK